MEESVSGCSSQNIQGPLDVYLARPGHLFKPGAGIPWVSLIWDEWRAPWHKLPHVSSNICLCYLCMCAQGTLLCVWWQSPTGTALPQASQRHTSVGIHGYFSRGRKGYCHLLWISWGECSVSYRCIYWPSQHTWICPQMPIHANTLRSNRLCCSNHLAAELLCRKQSQGLSMWWLILTVNLTRHRTTKGQAWGQVCDQFLG